MSKRTTTVQQVDDLLAKQNNPKSMDIEATGAHESNPVGGRSVEGSENGNSSLATLFKEEGSAIQTKRVDNVFERETTDDEQAIIAQRVALQRKMFEEYEKREKMRKIREVQDVCPDLTDEEAKVALDQADGSEEQAVSMLTGDANFMRKVKLIASRGSDVPAVCHTSNVGGPQSSSRRMPLPKPTVPGGVFVGAFRGKQMTGYRPRARPTGAAAAAAAPQPEEEPEQAAPVDDNHENEPRNDMDVDPAPAAAAKAKGPAKPQQSPDNTPAKSPAKAPAKTRQSKLVVSSKGKAKVSQPKEQPKQEEEPAQMDVEEQAEGAQEEAEETTAMPEAPATARCDPDDVDITLLKGRDFKQVYDDGNVYSGHVLKVNQKKRTLYLEYDPQGDSDEVEIDDCCPITDFCQAEYCVVGEPHIPGVFSDSSPEFQALANPPPKPAPKPAPKAKAQPKPKKEPVVKKAELKVAKKAEPKAEPEVKPEVEEAAVEEQEALPPAQPEPEAPAAAAPAAEKPEERAEVEASEEEAKPAPKKGAKGGGRTMSLNEGRQGKRAKLGAEPEEALAPAPAEEKQVEAKDEVQQAEQAAEAVQGGKESKGKEKVVACAAADEDAAAGPSTAAQAEAEQPAPMQTDDKADEEQTVSEANEAAMQDTPGVSSKAGAAGEGRAPRGCGGSGRAASKPLGHNSGRLGRVRRCNVKRCELVSIGTLDKAFKAKKGWCNKGYIFSDGFVTRTVFRSSVDIDQLCMHECSIYADGKFKPEPTFKIVTDDCPDKPIIGKSATACWKAVLDRINDTIARLRKEGYDLPPPPKTAIAGPEYFGLNQPEIVQMIEAMDPDRRMELYWAGREERAEIIAEGGGVSLPKQPRAAGGSGSSSRKRSRRRDEDGESDEDGEDETEYTTNRWSSVNRAARYKARHGGADEEDSDNPLPGFIDPITLEAVVNPAMSPDGHVMGMATWQAVLAEKGCCPFTKKPLRRDQLKLLTSSNITLYRDKIVAQ